MKFLRQEVEVVKAVAIVNSTSKMVAKDKADGNLKRRSFGTTRRKDWSQTTNIGWVFFWLH